MVYILVFEIHWTNLLGVAFQFWIAFKGEVVPVWACFTSGKTHFRHGAYAGVGEDDIEHACIPYMHWGFEQWI